MLHCIRCIPEGYVPSDCKCLCSGFFVGCGYEGNQDMWYPTGCAEQVQMWFVERLHIVGIVGLVVAFIQVSSLLRIPWLVVVVSHETGYFSVLSKPKL